MEWYALVAGALPAGGLVYIWGRSKMASLAQKTQAAEMALALAQNQLAEKKQEIEKLNENVKFENREVVTPHAELSKTATDLYQLKTKPPDNQEEPTNSRQTFLEQFHTVSNQVLGQNSAHFKRASAENTQRTLEPLKEPIKEFET